MEIALRRLEGVDKVRISISQQAFEVTYKPDARFQPRAIRDAVGQANVWVRQLRIEAKGQVQEDEEGKRFFVSGRDKFVLADSSQIPSNTSVFVLGAVDDSADPLKLTITDFKPAEE